MESGPNSERVGDEPMHARSPLKSRFFLAVGGAVFFAATAIVAIILADRAGWIGDVSVFATVFAIIAAVNAGIVWWRIHNA